MGWPHPSTVLNLAKVAKLTGISVSTYKKAITNIMAGKPHGSRYPQVGEVAQLFSGMHGFSTLIYASRIIEIFGEEPRRLKEDVDAIEVPPEPKVFKFDPYRFMKHERGGMKKLTEPELEARLRDETEKYKKSACIATIQRIEALVETMNSKGYTIPMIVVRNKNVKDIKAFASLYDFLGSALPNEAWIFLRIPGKRIIDVLSADDDDERYGELVLLTLSEYCLELMACSVQEQRAQDSKGEQAFLLGGLSV